jgi:hypothetical protein
LQLTPYPMTEPLTADDFTPHLGKAFRVAGNPQVLTLVTVDRRERLGGPRKPFTLILRGPRDDILPEGMYSIDADGVPGFELYIIPIHSPARDHQDYQIIFN